MRIQLRHDSFKLNSCESSYARPGTASTGSGGAALFSADGLGHGAELGHDAGDHGFDGLADGRHDCDAIAMDTGSVLSIRYDELLGAGMREPALLTAFHAAMSRELARDRSSLMSLCTLPSDARVAEFLRDWADSLASRGLRTDRITLRMTRAEIGNYLGMTLESVSRALSRLAREQVISFAESLGGSVMRMLGVVFEFGLRLAAPLIVVMLVVELATGLAAKAAPALNLMVVATPIRLIVGLLVVAALVPQIPGVTTRFVGIALEAGRALAQGLR